MAETETRLAAFMREQARNRDMSMNEFAKHVGVSAAALSAIRHGHTPTLNLIRQLAAKLDMPFNALAELAGIIDREGEGDEIPPEVRAVLRRYAKLPTDRQEAVLRMFDQVITFAEAQNR